jgi:hypothetical protein
MNAFLVDLNLPETEIIKTEKDKFGDILITIRTTEDSVACRVCGKRIRYFPLSRQQNSFFKIQTLVNI